MRIVLADDETMVCAHLRTILTAAGDLEVVAEAHDGAAAAEAVARLRPDLVLMDLRMPGVDGIAATARIRSMAEPPVVLVLTTFHDDDLVVRALAAGASGFLVKTTPPEDLCDLVRSAARGHSVLSPVVTEGLMAAARGRSRARGRLDGLTPREIEVLAGVADGLSNAAIAARLHLSEPTVKGYVSAVLSKLGCANRTQAGLLAHDAGLMSG